VINIRSRTVAAADVPQISQANKATQFVLLEFSDNGIGFEQQFSDKIFSIFQRLHKDKNFAGTGIGLALCKKIVENHKGVITVKSEQNKGTTFYIYLPLEQPEDSQLTNTSSIISSAF
jgi:light-regulated signal transduction histidine kinase (bacteriophytochrome)